MEISWRAISEVPFGLLTLVLTGLALAFNIGFFAAVGSQFISLFSIQEHILFSFSGINLIIPVYLSVSSLSSTLAKSTLPLILQSVVFAAFLAALDYAFYLATDVAPAVALFFVLLLSFALSRFTLDELRSFTKVQSVALGLFGLAIFAGITSGEWAKVRALDEFGPKAKLPVTGETAGLIRAGSTFSLLISENKTIHAIKTDAVAEFTKARRGSQQ